MAISISKKVFQFLKELEKNNNRDWFNENKPRFKALEQEMKHYFGELTEMLRSHDDIEAMKVFRIYRDVRFSKNKLPYKIHFSGSFKRATAKLRGGYYLHIEPGGSFIATGFWNPDKDDLFRIRKEFEMDDEEIRAILSDKKFKNVWGEIVGDELKSAPKGFSKEHKAIDLIKKKQFIFTKKFTDSEVLAPNFMELVNADFKAIRPYFNLMSDILTTDLNGESLI